MEEIERKGESMKKKERKDTLVSKVSDYLGFSQLLYLRGFGTRSSWSHTSVQSFSLLYKVVYLLDYTTFEQHIIWPSLSLPSGLSECVKSSCCLQLICCWSTYVEQTWSIFIYIFVKGAGRSERKKNINFLLIWISMIFCWRVLFPDNLEN